MGYVSKDERLKFTPISKEEKLKCMDRMLRYIRENSTNTDNKSVRSVQENCRIMASNDLLDLVMSHVVE